MRVLTCLALAIFLAPVFLSGCSGKPTAPIQTAVPETTAVNKASAPKLPPPPK